MMMHRFRNSALALQEVDAARRLLQCLPAQQWKRGCAHCLCIVSKAVGSTAMDPTAVESAMKKFGPERG